MNRLFTISFLCFAEGAVGQSGHVVHYELKMQELKTVFGGVPPVMHVKPGGIIDTRTVDADGKEPEAAGFKLGGPNPLTGPFYIDGAEPGDTLAVKFLAIETNAKEGFGSAGPGFGALNSSSYTPVLGGAIQKSEWPYEIDKGRMWQSSRPRTQTSRCRFLCIRF